MDKVLISASYSSGNSMIKSLAFINRKPSFTMFDTFHNTWNVFETQTGYYVHSLHELFGKRDDAKTVMIYNNPINIKQILQRSIMLEFLYADHIKKHNITQDTWGKDGIIARWTPKKYSQIAGDDWPPYSTNYKDYSKEIMNEFCDRAYDELKPWSTKTDADVIIDSGEIYGDDEPNGIRQYLELIDMKLTDDILQVLNEWKQRQKDFYEKYKHCFE